MTIAELHQCFLNANGVSTDTRTLTKNSLFFCLSGENFNGNTFAKKAFEQGAAYVVFDDKAYDPKNKKAIFVQDSLTTLQELAKYHRKQFDIPVIGLTGSNGKTTTKELIKSVLEQQYNVLATQGNLNNHIGVPLTLLDISSKTEIALIEMGANHLNEIAFLADIASPTLGYITNFGKAHLEGFGSLEGVVQGKSELYSYLKKNNGQALVNGNDPKQLQQSNGLNRLTFGEKKQEDYSLNGFINTEGYCCVQIDETEINAQLTGAYNLDNLYAAVSFGLYFGLPLTAIKKGIEAYLPENNRSQWIKTDHNTILLDAYNANPTSMGAALASFLNGDLTKKMVILGDMLELGTYTKEEHQAIVDSLKSRGIENALLVGPAFFTTTADNFKCFKTTEEAYNYLNETTIQGKTVLIKGSRGIALEQLLSLL